MRGFLIYICLLVCVYRQVSCWDNNFFQTLYKVCPDGTAVSLVRSTYTPWFGGDRRFEFRCSAIPYQWNQCGWLDFTTPGEGFSRVCPVGQVMKGVYAGYVGGDRVWNVYCCANNQPELRFCRSSRVYGYNLGFQFSPAPAYTTGITSFYHEQINDRSFSFGFCYL